MFNMLWLQQLMGILRNFLAITTADTNGSDKNCKNYQNLLQFLHLQIVAIKE